MKTTLIATLAIALLLAACSPSVPQGAVPSSSKARLSVDNDSAMLPPNIAPMNFAINEAGDDYVTHVWSDADHDGFTVGGREVEMPEDDWHALLAGARGHNIHTDVYVRHGDRWTRYRSILNPVSTDSIDPYITYRLIEPGYVDYEEMTICQRNLSNFEERQIYNNMMLSDGDNGQCINCHTPQDYGRTGRSLFHVRQAFGGTVFIHGDSVTKVNLKTDSTLSAGVYPAWHPKRNLVAFSVNETGQVFHTRDIQKIEVLDFASDLILYDADRNTVYDLDKRKDEFETFPAWSPNGLDLYYASAHFEQQTDDIDQELDSAYQQLKYNLYCRRMDPKTGKFGDRQLIFDAAALGKSAAFPRISPDGRWLLFSLGDYGQFHIWHRSGDLWLMDLTTHKAHALSEVNSPRTESYHTWSSNGRWMMFTSRRGDGNYTRLYFAHIDRDGHVSRPFLLPQHDADTYQHLLKSYNTPEFLTQPVKPTIVDLTQAIQQPAQPARYGGSALLHPDAGYDVSHPDDRQRVSSPVNY